MTWVLPFLLMAYPNGRGVLLAAALGLLELFWWPTAKALRAIEAGLALSVS